jgi:flavodoxin
VKKRVLLVVLLLLAWSSLGLGTAGAGFSAVMDFHVADEFIESGTGFDQTGAQAEVSTGLFEGHTVSVVGNGKFNVASGKASGGGTFVHRDENGDFFASGSWTAKSLNDFTFYGCGDGTTFPKNFCGGLATLSVEVLPHGGDPLSGVLTINCLIGEDATGEEEITLVVGGFNFDEDATEDPDGLTLFVSRSKG